ncbi:MAG: hypothetical protein AAF654_02575 [Myxococcota bacterium]
MRRSFYWTVIGGISLGAIGCQAYDFAFQPDTDLQEVALRFSVQTPSQADILFVVDNSNSMEEEQIALKESFAAFIDDLSATDTSYRIGITSTDAVGWSTSLEGDCDGNEFPPGVENGSKGDCSPTATSVLRYPHDGARGRLLSAYDPTVYDISNPIFDALSPDNRNALARLFPTGPSTGPCEVDNSPGMTCSASNPPYRVQCQTDAGTADVNCQSQGAEYVIDRELVNLNACKACGVAAGECERGFALFDGCATEVAGAYVNATFRANINGLGFEGQGWEQGIRAGLMAVGIEPAEDAVDIALNPPVNLTDPARDLAEAPNTFFTLDELGGVFRASWVRSDALLAVMYVTDEQECSMSDSFFNDGKSCFEEGCDVNPGNGQPTGSVCYQDIGQANLIGVEQMARLLLARKDEVASRVAVGFIGGLIRPIADDRSVATATDCISNAAGATTTPETGCFCVADAPDPRWCNFTTNGSATSPACNALSGSRYTDFAETFNRRTFESVCEADFSPALIDFGDIAKLSCFDLREISPANSDPANIRVSRSPRNLAEVGVAPTELVRTEDGSEVEGWYFVAGSGNRTDQICLNRIDRLIGDQYDVRILTTDAVDPRRNPVEPVQ